MTTVTAFHRALREALTDEPDEQILKDLAKQAEQLADMVGWADGIIDPDGRVADAFIQLQTQARSKHQATGDNNIAIIHDSIGMLLAAVAQHDEDLSPTSNNEEDNVG